MIPFELVSIFIDLQRSEARLAATDKLACYAGVARVMVFGKDNEVGIFLPAPGLPQTLPSGRRWQTFLRQCAASGSAHSSVPSVESALDLLVWGDSDSSGTVIVVYFEMQPAAALRAAIAALLPLLGAKLAGERAELAAAGLAAAASDSNRRSRELNTALDASRRELQAAYQLAKKELVSRREAEAKLRDADRRKDEFLAMLAHELRNPLAPISMAAKILGMEKLTAARAKQTSQIIERQIGHMTSLLDDLLDVSRVTRGLVTLVPELHNIGAIVNDAVEQARPLFGSRSQCLTLALSAHGAQVRGDGTRLVQILTNLLNNASKYTPRGGAIELELTQDATMVQIVVRDNGIGIDSKLLPDIFDLFVQGERSPDRAQGGLGLGLALVKNLVERHQGSVSAASKGPGAGSEFTVRLPRAYGVAQVLKPCESSSAAGTGKDILIVDDNVDAADTLSLFLSTVGHRMRVAYDGSTAIGMVEQSPPEVLILDIGLPDIDGYDLARQVRALPQTASAILVALTGYGQPADRERSVAAGFNHHLTKPVDAAVLLRLLASVSQRPAG